jgi:hypothetical protein
VTEDRFNENVFIGKDKSGRYYWRSGLIEARKEFGAVPYKKCRPDRITPLTPKW